MELGCRLVQSWRAQGWAGGLGLGGVKLGATEAGGATVLTGVVGIGVGPQAESTSAASRKILTNREGVIFRFMGFSCGSKNPVTND